MLDAVAQQHAVPAAATADPPIAIPTGQESPLLQAIAQQHAIPTDAEPGSAAVAGSGSLFSPLTEADLQERTKDAKPSGMQSGWLTAWFRKGAAQAPADSSKAVHPSAGAGSLSRLGNSLTTSFSSAQSSAAPATTKPLADLAGVRLLPSFLTAPHAMAECTLCILSSISLPFDRMHEPCMR